MLEEKLHGEPLEADSRSGEPPIAATARVRLQIVFELDLSNYGGPIIPIKNPPARLIDRVATLLVRGPEGLAEPAAHPQPNDLFGKLLPPPSATE